jgi:hypothetical protein
MTGMLSGIAGVLSGVGGSLITNIFNLFTTKQKDKHEIELIDARIREMEAESKLKIQEIQIQGEIQKEVAAQGSFDVSQKYGNKSLIESEMILKLFESRWTRWMGVLLVFLMATVDVVRAAMRPGITIALMIITGALSWEYIQIAVKSKSLIDAATITMIFDCIIYLTFTAVGWWFGDRTIGKFVKRR